VPDGALSLVPFDALPIGQTAFLLERAPVLHVSCMKAGSSGI